MKQVHKAKLRTLRWLQFPLGLQQFLLDLLLLQFGQIILRPVRSYLLQMETEQPIHLQL